VSLLQSIRKTKIGPPRLFWALSHATWRPKLDDYSENIESNVCEMTETVFFIKLSLPRLCQKRLLGCLVPKEVEELQNGTTLIEAVKAEQNSVFALILTREHVLRCKESWEPRALHEAVKFGSLWATKLLIHIGIDCSIPDDNGYIPLHTAASEGETVCWIVH
jgi:hypothetical protein